MSYGNQARPKLASEAASHKAGPLRFPPTIAPLSGTLRGRETAHKAGQRAKVAVVVGRGDSLLASPCPWCTRWGGALTRLRPLPPDLMYSGDNRQGGKRDRKGEKCHPESLLTQAFMGSQIPLEQIGIDFFAQF